MSPASAKFLIEREKSNNVETWSTVLGAKEK
jgi:hypothetical protein